MRKPCRLVTTLVVILASIICSGLWLHPRMATATAPASGTEDPWQLCRQEITQIENEEHIPHQLLHAIAQVEAGRYSKEAAATIAWPWTVMAEGRGRFLPTKQAAIAEVKRLRKAGVENIDVGCMQVNLRAHLNAFANLEEAFDPATNVAYAARFLKSLREQGRSWVKAVANYHSATPKLHIVYRAKVFAAWRTERRRALESDRLARRREQAKQLVELQFSRTGPVGADEPYAAPGNGA